MCRGEREKECGLILADNSRQTRRGVCAQPIDHTPDQLRCTGKGVRESANVCVTSRSNHTSDQLVCKGERERECGLILADNSRQTRRGVCSADRSHAGPAEVQGESDKGE